MKLKCDVYSFGVIILETLSGQRNGSTQRLLSHVSPSCWVCSLVVLCVWLSSGKAAYGCELFAVDKTECTVLWILWVF
jgi:hypothetical protein